MPLVACSWGMALNGSYEADRAFAALTRDGTEDGFAAHLTAECFAVLIASERRQANLVSCLHRTAIPLVTMLPIGIMVRATDGRRLVGERQTASGKGYTDAKLCTPPASPSRLLCTTDLPVLMERVTVGKIPASA